MNQSMFLTSRLTSFHEIVSHTSITDDLEHEIGIESGIEVITKKLQDLRASQGSLYIIGNGGSASVASHAVTDFFNVANIKAQTLHDSSLLTCMANDYGYENAFGRMLSQIININDIVILISSSGKSMNIRIAATESRRKKAFIITLSGFLNENPLRKLGNLNIWLDSKDYGFVEIGHQFILHNIADRFKFGVMDQIYD